MQRINNASSNPDERVQGKRLRLRLLVADDSEDFRDPISFLFELDDRVEVIGRAVNGEEAIEAAAVLKPDVVLLDVRIQNPDAVSTCAILSRLFQNLAIVFMADLSCESVREMCRTGGAQYVIDKSRCKQELCDLLAEIVKP